MRYAWKFFSIWMIFAGILSGSSLFDQSEKPSRRQKVPQHDAAAIVKLIPVRVLDADGRPVQGLEKEDFVLYDNKELKTITEFEIYEMGEIKSPIGEQETVAQPKVRPQTNRKYFILLDIQGSDEVGMANAKAAALKFVETKIMPGDEVGVFSFAPMTGLIIQQYLSADLEKIKKGIERVKEVPPTPGFSSGGELVEDERKALEKREAPQLSGSSIAPFQGSRVIGVQGLRAHARKHVDFATSMAELAKVVKYIPGSKNLVFFSSREPGKTVARLFAEANAPIFAVNTKNWIIQGIIQLSVKKKHIYHEHPLRDFAEASGGHYFADIKDIQTIADEIEVLSGNYYVLGYYINEKWDGRFHQIRIEVKKPGLKVLAQDGYYNPKPFAALTDIEKKIHLINLAFADKPSAPFLDLPVKVFHGAVMKEANILVMSEFRVDEPAGIPAGIAEIFIFTFDGDQNMVAAERGELDFSAHAQKTLYSYLLKKLEPGDYECRIVARDMETGESLVGRCLFCVPKPASDAMTILSPLLLIPGKKAEFFRFSQEKKKGKNRASLIDFYPFLPQNTSPFLGTLGFDIKKLWALVPVHFKSKELFDVRLELEMIEESGGITIPVAWNLIDRNKVKSVTDFLLYEIRLPDLKPGSYRLVVTAIGAREKVLASVSAPMRKR